MSDQLEQDRRNYAATRNPLFLWSALAWTSLDGIEPLKQDRQNYEATLNPIYVWSALASASLDESEPLPPWIMDYLRESALALCRLPMTKPRPTAAVMCRALGLILGKKNFFAEMSKDNDDVWTASIHRMLGGDDEAARRLAIASGASSPRQIETTMQNIRRATARSKSARRSID